jgi:hypothetical protein
MLCFQIDFDDNVLISIDVAMLPSDADVYDDDDDDDVCFVCFMCNLFDFSLSVCNFRLSGCNFTDFDCKLRVSVHNFTGLVFA